MERIGFSIFIVTLTILFHNEVNCFRIMKYPKYVHIPITISSSKVVASSLLKSVTSPGSTEKDGKQDGKPMIKLPILQIIKTGGLIPDEKGLISEFICGNDVQTNVEKFKVYLHSLQKQHKHGELVVEG